MMAFVWEADLYCCDCLPSFAASNGYTMEEYEKQRRNKTINQDSYDEWLNCKFYVYEDGGGESDCPQHCGFQDDCVSAEVLSNGSKVGKFLRNPLTSDGVNYVIESMADGFASEVVAMWVREYKDEISYVVGSDYVWNWLDRHDELMRSHSLKGAG